MLAIKENIHSRNIIARIITYTPPAIHIVIIYV